MMKLVEETCGFQNVQLPCSSEFISLAEIIIRGEDGLMGFQATNAKNAKALYIELLEKIKKLQTCNDHTFISRNQFGNAK